MGRFVRFPLTLGQVVASCYRLCSFVEELLKDLKGSESRIFETLLIWFRWKEHLLCAMHSLEQLFSVSKNVLPTYSPVHHAWVYPLGLNHAFKKGKEACATADSITWCQTQHKWMGRWASSLCKAGCIAKSPSLSVFPRLGSRVNLCP